MAHSFPGRLLALAAALAAAGAARAAGHAPSDAILLYDDPAPGATSLHWKLENRGGGRAEDVTVAAEPTWRYGAAAFSEAVSLDPGETVEADFEIGPLPGPGVWLVPLRVAGWDAAGRFTRAWRCARFSAPGPAAPAPVAFSLSSDPRDGASRGPFGLRVELRSRSDAPVSAHVRLLLPSGLDPEGPDSENVRFDAALAPGGSFATNVPLHVSTSFANVATVRAVAWTDPVAGAPAWGETRFVRFDVAEEPGADPPLPRRLPWGVAAALAAWSAACAAFGVRRRRRGGAAPAAPSFRWEELAVVLAATAYLAWMLQAWLVFAPGLVLGGDLPAHHYLMDHVARTGRLVSWADGWWGGFPMFRYYFPLPYAAMAAFGRLAGHDLAFKLGSIAGVLALPLALWGAARIARLPRPAPAFFAALALPLALDNTHDMWGANAYSTLAGMVANSWSFALFPVSLALAARDVRRERFSALSSLVFAALALSHFFTSVLAALALGAFALALLAAHRFRAFRALALEGILAAALAAWWLLPLLATGGWSVAFGEQWDIRFWRQLPPLLAPAWLAAAAVAAAAAMLNAECRMQNASRPPFSIQHSAFCILHFFLFLFSLFLFYFGRSVAEVFVNCRLWPFLVYAMLAGVALAWAALARAWRAPRSGAFAFFALCAALAWNEGGSGENPAWSRAMHARYWAGYNLRGVEAQPCGGAFFRLAKRVRGRPGLVACDMTDANEALGSSRCFEALPYVAPGTRTLEGGIVNSALGSLAAYTVQGEVSDAPAGWPLLVSPREFDPDSGLRHLELLGVRTFIARSRAVQAAFDADPAWTLLGAEGPADRWKVYGSTLEGVPDVRAWKTPLRGRDPGAETARPAKPTELQAAIAAWWASRGATEDLFPLTGPDAVPVVDAAVRIAEAATNAPPEPGWLDRVSDPVRLGAPAPDGSIRFEAVAAGRPHVVAATWYPDWVADGAEGPYLLSSGQLVVYPTAREVVLRHAKLPSETAGRIVSAFALLALLFPASAAFARRAGKRRPGRFPREAA